jgi:hypothetical protein
MQKEPWDEFWNYLGLTLFHFQELGLTPTSSDLDIWQACQTNYLVLITNNRNARSSDSLEVAIQQHNRPDCLPVFTVGNLDRFRKNRDYADRVLRKLYDYLMRIDDVRGTGRLYLP